MVFAFPHVHAQAPHPGKVLTDSLWSQSLGTKKKLLVYLPPSYDAAPARRYPVAYYLHGAWGAEHDWVRLGRIDAAMDSLVRAGMTELIVVMPDGDDSWYTTWNSLASLVRCPTDSTHTEARETYCVPWARYDDYIARDVVQFIDRRYRTISDREHRGIAGLSMGGFGATTLALRYPDVFSAAASHSGVLFPTLTGPTPYRRPGRFTAIVDSIRLRAALWPVLRPVFGRDIAGWRGREPATLARRLASRGGPRPSLFIDIGVGDTYVEQNRALRDTLSTLGFDTQYAEWPGVHDWVYWRTHVRESLAWLASRLSRPAPGP